MVNEEGFPISAWQRRGWSWRRLGPSLELSVEMPAGVEPARLAAAAEAVIAGCEILRTRFREVPGLPFPLQVVGAAGPRLLAEARPELPEPRSAAPFALAWDAPGRVLALRAHPLVADRATLHLFLAALARELGPAGGAGEEPAAALQYADFAAAIDEMRATGELAAAAAWWQKDAAAAAADGEAPRLPAVRPPGGGGEPEPAAGLLSAELEVELAAELAAGAAEGLELGALAVACLRFLLGRLGGGELLPPLGVYSDLRDAMQLADVFGPMSDWLPIRRAVAGGLSWREAAADAAALLARGREHQGSPPLADGACPAVGFVDDRSRPPLPAAAGNWRIGRIRLRLDGTPLVFALAAGTAGTARLAADFDPRRIAAGDAENLLARWAALIARAAAAPEAAAEGTSLFLPGEPPILGAPPLSGAPRALPGALFARAAADPEAPAVCAPGLAWSAGRLAAEVAALARRLRAAGIGPGRLVAYRFEPGVDLLVAPLAVWSAGAAWLPIDADAPADLVAFLLADSGADLLLHGPGLAPAARPEAVRAAAALELDRRRDGAAPPSCLAGFAPHPAADDELAYLLYTSGSTGRPNGARLRHGGLRCYLEWAAGELLAGLSGLPVTARPTFDASLKQLFAPLLAGREVLFPPRDAVRQPALLLEFLGAEPGRGLNAVPALVLALVDSAEARLAAAGPAGRAALPEIAAFLVGGAALAPGLLQRINALWPRAEVRNLYGLTETTANNLAARLAADRPIALGEPVAGSLLAVVDGEGRPLPPLAEGELWIGGDGLAESYHRRPELDAARFAALEADGVRRRFLRTGDRGYRRVDGSVVFLGRRDDQLEVRGFRIEKGEVEAALEALPGVVAAAVDRRDDAAGGHLVAWVEGKAAALPDLLRIALGERLPAHLLPSRIVPLEALPRLANGKIDRRALAARADRGEETASPAMGRAPREELELAVAAVWAEVVGSPPPGIDLDFFSAGGHSLLMARLARRLSEALRVEVPLAEALNRPTVAGLAALAGAARGGAVGRRHLVRLRAPAAADGGPPCVFVHPSGGSVRAFYGALGHLDAATPIYALQAAGLADDGGLPDSLAAMAAAYLEDLAEVPAPRLLVGWSFGGLVAYEMARQRPEQVRHLLLLDAAPPDLLAARRGGDDEIARLLELFGRNLAVGRAELRALPDRRARLEALRRAGIAAGKFSPETRREELERYLRVFENNLAAGIRYRPDRAAWPDLPVTLVRARDETLWREEGQAAPPEDLGWSRFLPRSPRVHWVAGSHDALFEPEFLPAVAEAIRRLRE